MASTDFAGDRRPFEEDTDNYLGSLATVDAIVRNFLADAINVRAAWLAGKRSAEDPEVWLKDRSTREANRFLGRDNSMIPVVGWNAPDGGIIDGVRKRFDLKAGDPVAIVAYPFAVLIDAYLDAEAEAAEGRDWEHLVDGAIELTVATLMGTDELIFPFEAG